MKIGDRVVCIKTHSQGIIKKGEEFFIKGVNICLVCKTTTFDIGIKHRGSLEECTCGRVYKTGEIWFISHEILRKIEPNFTNELTRNLARKAVEREESIERIEIPEKITI